MSDFVHYQVVKDCSALFGCNLEIATHGEAKLPDADTDCAVSNERGVASGIDHQSMDFMYIGRPSNPLRIQGNPRHRKKLECDRRTTDRERIARHLNLGTNRKCQGEFEARRIRL